MFKFYLLNILLFLSVAASAQKLTVEANPVQKVFSELLQRQFDDYKVFQIDLRSLNQEILKREPALSIQFQFGNDHDWPARLIPNDIRAENYQLKVTSEDGDFKASRSRNKTFIGYIEGDQGGPVRLTIDRNFIYGFFKYEGEAYFIEPLKRFKTDAALDQFLFYKASDVKPVQGQKCALNEIKDGLGQQVQKEETDAEKAFGQCYTVEIALAADFSMFNQFGNVTSTENQMLGILNLVQGNYDDDFDDEISFQVVTTFVSDCPACDPWTTSTDAGTLLTSFANWGNGGGFGVNFDVATLWTDRDFNGETIGVAWPGTLCTSQKYNTCQDFSFSANALRVLQAHELGHNFNAGHDAQGSPTIMAPAVTNTNSWSPVSQADISSYIANVGTSSSCFTNCAPALPPVASIFAPVNNICPGSAIPFFDNSSNGPTSWTWNFPGGSPSGSNQQNPTVVYESPGSYPVILTVTNDAGADATSLSFDINVTDAGTKYLVYETFELGPTNFVIDNPDGAITWAITNVGGTQAGNRAIFVNNYDYDASGQKDALISLPFDFSGESDIMMELDYAYRRYDNNLKDKLRILISVDGGNTFPFTAFQGDETGSGNFATAPDDQSAFTPATQNDWCFGTDFGADCIAIDLSSLSGEPNVVIKIENETGFGNNMYIDNLIITSSCQPLLPPSAAFAANIQQGCTPLEVNFENQSTGMITQYNWSFPGGTPSFSSMPNPTITYNFPGVYDVILSVENGAGTSTAEEFAFVIVEGDPALAFNYEVEGLTAFFDNQSISGNSFLWDFGDGNTSNAFNPNHTYDQEGEYSVTLSATNDCGMASIEKVITVISPITAGFSTSETSGCAPFEVTFEGQPTGDGLSYAWTFDNGVPSTSMEANPTVTYNNAGVFGVSLTVTNAVGSDTFEESMLIEVGGQPSAGFDFETTLGENTVGFNNTSVDATSFIWDFGDGESSESANPTHTYEADGTYLVQMIATNACGSDTTEQEIVILSPPEASFTANETSGCAPFQVNFSGQPSGDGLTYAWVFEGGNPATSAVANPTVVYENAGEFSVSLIVSNAAGSDTIEETTLIAVDSLPTANFEISTTLGESNADFANNSTNADGYTWDFGDGESSESANPTHTYEADGTYLVQMIATNACGSDTTEQEIVILSPPEASFTANETSGCAPFEVNFSGQPSGDGLTYAWVFEGGNPATSTVANPMVVYENAGEFSVSLIVSNASGSDTIEEATLIAIDSLPTASFEISTTLGESDADFANNSTNANGYTWDFGDGESSESANPTHTYEADGTYLVQMIATNACGSDTTEQEIVILSPPEASFTANETSGCAPFEVNFSGQPSGDGLTYAWVFEGGNPATSAVANPTIVYENAGEFSVSLIVSNAAGSDTIEETAMITIDSLPTANFEISTTLGESNANFANNSTNADGYTWDFGDGESSESANPTHTYEADGTYLVQMIATNACGSDTTEQEIVILSPPEASFTANETSGCAPFEVNFSGQPSGDGLTYAWVFEGGNPATSSVANPTIVYENAGEFSVSLIVSNAAGSDTIEETTLITIDSLPTASFEISTTLGESNANFANNSTNADGYTWDFGDGESSESANPTHTYEADGTYLVQMIATNACGSDTTEQEIVILSPPEAGFTANETSGCAPFEVNFSGQPSGDGLTYAWIFEGGNPATSAVANPMVVYENAGEFSVSLIVSNAAGSDTIEETSLVVVDSLPIAGFNIDYNIGDNFANFANTSSQGLSYYWHFGDDSTSTEENPIHEFLLDGTYEIELIVENECGADTLNQAVTIVTPPKADFQASTTNGCLPFEVQFAGQTPGEGTTFAWTFIGGNPATSTLQNPVVVYEAAGSFDVVLVLSNAAGEDTAMIENYIVVEDIPTPGFSSFVNGFTVQFENTSIAGFSYVWDFGDGNSSEEETPIHIYETEGVFTVTLMVVNDCGSESIAEDIEINVDFPTADFTASIEEGCVPLIVEFASLSENADSIAWSFPGGTPATSNVLNPIVIYDEPGLYDVLLEAFNAFGDATIMEAALISVGAGPPEANFTYEANGLNVNFQAQTIGDGLSYEWLFGDETSSLEMNPSHTYGGPGTYEVFMIISNECGADTIGMEIELIVNELENMEWVDQFELFPNPNNGQFSLLLRGHPQQILQIQVINVIGQTLYRDDLDFRTGYLKKAFDFSRMPAGIYLVQLQSGKSFAYKKVLIE